MHQPTVWVCVCCRGQSYLRRGALLRGSISSGLADSFCVRRSNGPSCGWLWRWPRVFWGELRRVRPLCFRRLCSIVVVKLYVPVSISSCTLCAMPSRDSSRCRGRKREFVLCQRVCGLLWLPLAPLSHARHPAFLVEACPGRRLPSLSPSPSFFVPPPSATTTSQGRYICTSICLSACLPLIPSLHQSLGV